MTLPENHLSLGLSDWAALSGELLLRDHTVRLRVRGWSMHPAIRDGEVIWIAPIGAGRPRLGDVLLGLGARGRPFVHRCIRRRRQAGELLLCIAADQVPGAHEWVPAQQVLGRVVAVERAGRRISLFGIRGRLWGWAWLLVRPLRPVIGWLRRSASRLSGKGGLVCGYPNPVPEESPGIDNNA